MAGKKLSIISVHNVLQGQEAGWQKLFNITDWSTFFISETAFYVTILSKQHGLRNVWGVIISVIIS